MEKIQYNTHHERSEESFRTFGLLDGSYLGREESIVDAVFRGAGRVSSTVTVQDMDLSGNPEISNKASLSRSPLTRNRIRTGDRCSPHRNRMLECHCTEWSLEKDE